MSYNLAGKVGPNRILPVPYDLISSRLLPSGKGKGSILRTFYKMSRMFLYLSLACCFQFITATSLLKQTTLSSIAARIALRVADGLPPRPRFILDADRLNNVRNFISNTSESAGYFKNVMAQADWILSVQPFYIHTINNTGDLGGARQVLQRVYALSIVYRITGNETYAIRCDAELANAIRWHDWDLFDGGLVTAELLHATAMGLDQLDSYWKSSPDRMSSRVALVNGMVELGMKAFYIAYQTLPPYANQNTFINATNCYGLVVNGGAVIGAVALLGESPDLVPAWVAEVVLSSALMYLVDSYESYAPVHDGSWYEGPNYHLYAVRYTVPTVFSLISVLGYDFDLLSYPGIESTAHAIVAQLSPQQTFFNWADTHEEIETSAAALALASYFNDAASAFAIREVINDIVIQPNETGDISMQATVGLLYYTPLGSRIDRAAMLKDTILVGRDVATFSSNTSDKNATYVGIKAGTNGGNVHLHQDAGTFIFHSQSERFFADLGSDNYGLFCYFCPPIRWNYYRLNAFGHNTVTFNNKTHDYPATGHIINFNSTGNSGPPLYGGVNAFAIMDLSTMYASIGISWKRGFVLLQNREILVIVDEFSVGGGMGANFQNPPGELDTVTVEENIEKVKKNDDVAQNLTWAAHTNATVTIMNKTATINTRNGATATLIVLPSSTQCPELDLEAIPVDLAPPQLSSTGLVRIQLFSGNVSGCKRISVLIGTSNVPLDLVLNKLNDWNDLGPLV